MKHAICIIHPKDNVAVALRDLEAGETVTAEGGGMPLTVTEPVPASHKIALADIRKGEEIIKYGETVGVSTGLIQRGAWVHNHNLESGQWKAS